MTLRPARRCRLRHHDRAPAPLLPLLPPPAAFGSPRRRLGSTAAADRALGADDGDGARIFLRALRSWGSSSESDSRTGAARAATHRPRALRYDDVETAARASLSPVLTVTARRGGLAESRWCPGHLETDRRRRVAGWAVVTARREIEGDGEGIGRVRRRRGQLCIGAARLPPAERQRPLAWAASHT